MMTMRRVAATAALVAGAALTTATPAMAAPVYYANCDAARAAGAAPIQRGEPGYRAGLDRDGDGIACEGTSGTDTPGRPAQPAGSAEDTGTPTGSEQASLPDTGTTLPLPLLIGAGGVLVLGGAGLVRAGVAVRAGRHRA